MTPHKDRPLIIARSAAAIAGAAGVLAAIIPREGMPGAVFSPTGALPGLVLLTLAAGLLLGLRSRTAVLRLAGTLVAIAALASLSGIPLMAGPRQYLLAVFCIGAAFATFGLRSRFLDVSDFFALFGTAVLVLALGGYLVTFWPYYAEGVKDPSRLGPGTALVLLLLCAGLAALQVDRGVTCVLVSSTPAGVAARMLLPIPFVFPFLFSAVNLWSINRKLYEPYVGIWLFALANTLVFALLISWSALQLYRAHTATAEAQRLLRAANENLERRVAERTAELTKEIAERKAAIEELARTNAQLEEFAYVASHDLKEPIRTVNSYAQLLGRRYASKLDADGLEFLDYIQQGALRMNMLVSDLLDYARAAHERTYDAVDLNECLRDALADLRGQIEETRAVITAGTLPLINGHRQQMIQVLVNLIANALKYRSPDYAPLIHVAANADGPQWVLSVRDNGIGIDPQYFGRIFGLFKRLHRDKYPGTGVGLALCKRVVESHGGRIWVESKAEEGSTFYFSVPDRAHTAKAAFDHVRV